MLGYCLYTLNIYLTYTLSSSPLYSPLLRKRSFPQCLHDSLGQRSASSECKDKSRPGLDIATKLHRNPIKSVFHVPYNDDGVPRQWNSTWLLPLTYYLSFIWPIEIHGILLIPISWRSWCL